jgi:hypothetical protein
MDGLTDGEEIYATPQTNPNDDDTDGDTLTDYQEVRQGFLLSLTINGFLQAPKRVYPDPTKTDTDDDGISDYDELFGLPVTDPTLADTDGDGLTDGEEVLTYGTNPLDSDDDGDGLTDGMEVRPDLRPAPTNAFGKTYYNNVNSDDDSCTDLLGNPKYLSDYDEVFIFKTNPTYEDDNNDGDPDGMDSDGDGLNDCEEVYIYNTDPSDADTDDDDTNVVSCNDFDEVQIGTDPRTDLDCPPAATPVDGDLDGLWDEWELRYFPTLATATGNGAGGGAANSDTDQCNNLCEQNQGTNPTLDDTDGDGLADHLELANFADPLLADTDGDGLNDQAEIQPGTVYPGWPYAASNPRRVNSDTDNLTDFEEVTIHQTNPNHPDTDGDGVIDHCEVNPLGCSLANAPTSPKLADTDNDGLNDFQEIFLRGTNPNLADSDSDSVSDGLEVNTYATNPVDNDTDDDGLLDGQEISGILSFTITFLNPPGGSTTISLQGYNPSTPSATDRLNPFVDDVDGDGLEDGFEFSTLGTNPLDIDTEDDGLTDGFEVNDGNANSEPLRDDSKNVNLDTDGDGIANIDEETGTYGYRSDPNLVDSDGDLISDFDEMVGGLDLKICFIDKDGAVRDGQNAVVANCSAAPILNFITNPTHLDTNPADGTPDGFDTDKDGLDDEYESGFINGNSFNLGNGSFSPLDPTYWDTDRDGLSDRQEIIRYSTNPVNASAEKTIIDTKIPDTAFITNVFEVANQGSTSTAISNASLGLGYTVSGTRILLDVQVLGQNSCSPGLTGNDKNFCFTDVRALLTTIGATEVSSRTQAGKGYIKALVPVTVIFDLIRNTKVVNIAKG